MRILMIFFTLMCLKQPETVDCLIFTAQDLKNFLNSGALDVNVMRCLLRNKDICPNPYIEYRLYTP